MNKKMIAVIFLALSVLACGTQLPQNQSTGVNTEPTYQQIPVKVLTSAEPTESAPIYVTTAPLNVRSEANADSQILGVLEAGTVVTVFILDIRGDDCYTGEWYAIGAPVEGYVCSLYVEEVK